MLLLRKLALFAVLGCVPAWAQSSSAPEPANSSGQHSQSSHPAPDSDKTTSTTQTPPPSPGDSTNLEPIKTEKAIYPLQAEQKQLQGEVWLKILVSETGDVENIEVISGDPILADAAVRAVKKWKFKAFIKNGKPIKASAKLPIDFAFGDKIMEKGVSADGSTTADRNASPPSSSPFGLTNPSAATSSNAPNRVRVSSGVSQGLLIRQIAPVYPPEARRAHVQGAVVLQALISKEGRITELKVISGPSRLRKKSVRVEIGGIFGDTKPSPATFLALLGQLCAICFSRFLAQTTFSATC
jgi:TonB family protein